MMTLIILATIYTHLEGAKQCLRNYECMILSHTTLGSRLCVLSCFSHVWLFVTPWTVAHQAPLSMGFSRQEYWSGWPSLPAGDFPNPGIESMSLMSPPLAGGCLTNCAAWEAQAEDHLQIKSLRVREVKWLAQGQTTNKHWNWDLKTSLSDSKIHAPGHKPNHLL